MVESGFGSTTNKDVPRQHEGVQDNGRPTFELLAPRGQEGLVEPLWLPHEEEEIVTAVRDLPKLFVQTSLVLVRSHFEGTEVRMLAGLVVDYYDEAKRAAVEAAQREEQEASRQRRQEAADRDRSAREQAQQLVGSVLQPLRGQVLDVPVLSRQEQDAFRFGRITAQDLAAGAIKTRAEEAMPINPGGGPWESYIAREVRDEAIRVFAKEELARIIASGELQAFEVGILPAAEERHQACRRKWEEKQMAKEGGAA